MKKVFFGFPSLTGQVDVRFMDALLNTIRAGLEKGIDICPYFVTDDAILQRVRNDIFHTAVASQIEDCFFVDSDIVWEPNDLFKLLINPLPVVGATYRKKVDEIAFVGINEFSKVENGMVETDSLGLGFVKINRNVLVKIYEESSAYFDIKSNDYKKAIFNIEFTKDDGMISEDVLFFRKLKKMGIKTFIDTSINLGHIGRKVYQSSLREYLK